MLRNLLRFLFASEPAPENEQLSHMLPYRTNSEAVAHIMRRARRERSQYIRAALGG